LHEPGIKGATAQHISEIRGAAQRASHLTSQLLAFSRKHPLEPRVVEVNSIITNLERSLLRLLGEDITVECHLQRSAQPAHIKADPGQLTQIILNLAVNARDAMPEGGRLTLGTGSFRVDDNAHPCGCPERLAPGDYVMISVTDTGVGMTEEAKEHLFEPFFTTKDDGNSSGLGLATSYGIVRQSGGQMCVTSDAGRGTMITIYLPKAVAPPVPGYKKPGSKKLPTGKESILVVEDDVAVRHIAVRVLRSLGYDVVEAASGDDAQRLISLDENKKIDLLLSDLVMPLMGGRDFAEWMTNISPSTKVIFISGYLDQSFQAQDQSDVGMFFLPKPFDPEQLAQKVREALDCCGKPKKA
jgi:CheY-like chemotaxis protein